MHFFYNSQDLVEEEVLILDIFDEVGYFVHSIIYEYSKFKSKNAFCDMDKR